MALVGCQAEEFLDSQVPSAGSTFGGPQNLEEMERHIVGAQWIWSVGRSESATRQPTATMWSWNMIAGDELTLTNPITAPYENQGNYFFFYNRDTDHLLESRPSDAFGFCYSVLSTINQASFLIENPTTELLQEQLTEPERYREAVGQVHALRSQIYWILYRLYGPKYMPGGDNSRPSVIIRNTNSSDFDDLFNTRSTVQEVMDLLESDLKLAAANLGSGKRVGYMNRGAALAMLVRVYLEKNDWAMVEAYADSVLLEGYSLDPDPFTPFAQIGNVTSSELIHEMRYDDGGGFLGAQGIDRIGFNRPIMLGYWNWIERRTMGAGGFNGKDFTVDNAVYRTYPLSRHIMSTIGWAEADGFTPTTLANSDLRYRDLLHYAPAGTDTRLTINMLGTVPPIEDYIWVFKDARSASDNVRNGNDFTYELYEGMAHWPLIRLPEVLLSRAIARLRLGNLSGALDDLNRLKEARWDTDAGAFVPYSGGEADVEREIELERAREYLGEADRMFYLQAMQYPVPSGDRGEPDILPPYDELFWPLPPGEVNLNPNLD